MKILFDSTDILHDSIPLILFKSFLIYSILFISNALSLITIFSFADEVLSLFDKKQKDVTENIIIKNV